MNKDQKPQLSPKTIEINIDYHKSIIEKYQRLIQEEQAKITKWKEELKQHSQLSLS